MHTYLYNIASLIVMYCRNGNVQEIKFAFCLYCICKSVCLSLSRCLYLGLSRSASLCICLAVYLTLSRCVSLNVCLSIALSLVIIPNHLHTKRKPSRPALVQTPVGQLKKPLVPPDNQALLRPRPVGIFLSRVIL